MGEYDHGEKSFKMYRENGGKLKFGPNWDYDSCVLMLPYLGTYVENPWDYSQPISNTYFGESWSRRLFNDDLNGRPLFKNIWNKLSVTELEKYIENMSNEIRFISPYFITECDLWMESRYYIVFDNLTYTVDYIKNKVDYLKTFVYI